MSVRDERIINDMERELGYHVNDPNIFNYGETPLMWVNLTSDPLNYTKLLIKMGADPNNRSYDNSTSLHYAVANENPDTLKYLLSVGANPFLKDDDGDTPYDLAKYYEHIIEAYILKDAMIRKIQNKQLRRMTRRRARTMRSLATAKSMLNHENLTYGNTTYGNPMSYMDYDTMSHLMSNYLM